MRNINLRNKKLLYIGPVSFGYDEYLIKELRSSGAIVDSADLYPRMEGIYSQILLKFRKNGRKSDAVYYDTIALRNGYDYVLVRHGHQLPSEFFEKLRNNNPNALFINFHWDSLKPDYNYLPTMKYFDRIFSFDFKDCDSHQGINYLPLFYIKEYSGITANFKKSGGQFADLLFIGAWRNKERYSLIKQTEKLSIRLGLKFKYYLQLSILDQMRYAKRGVLAKDAKAKRLTHQEILKMFSCTNAVIDFPSSFQTGLTIRTFEALAAGKKVITTNQYIFREPFYDPEFIRIINPNKLSLDVDFIKKCPNYTLKEKLKDYSIESYIQKLFQ